MRKNAKSLERNVWETFLSAVTEAAVVAEQQRLSSAKSHDEDIAFIGEFIANACPKCKQLFADFSGCLSLTCGAWFKSGSNYVGCGAQFCGYCGTIGDNELAVHDHLRTSCVWNPRPGNLYPQSDYEEVRLLIKRERVWLHVVTNLSHRIPEIWSAIQHSYPELCITPHWLAQRQEWLPILAEMQISVTDFAHDVPLYTRCVTRLAEMGFNGPHVLRATLLYKGDPEKCALALIDNMT
jgi:hypothetical protein